MGTNSYGVAIGNEAVWNRLSDPDFDAVPRLLGMDLLRYVNASIFPKKIFLHIGSFGNSIRFSLFNRHQCIKYFFSCIIEYL